MNLSRAEIQLVQDWFQILMGRLPGRMEKDDVTLGMRTMTWLCRKPNEVEPTELW